MKYFLNRVAFACCVVLSACGTDGRTVTNNDISSNNIAGDIATMEDLQKVITANRNVLVDFYADWCGPCKQMEPAVANITRQYEGKVLVLRINVDKAEALSKDMGIEAIPYLVFYKDGSIKNELEGYQREEVLKQNIDAIYQ